MSEDQGECDGLRVSTPPQGSKGIAQQVFDGVVHVQLLHQDAQEARRPHKTGHGAGCGTYGAGSHVSPPSLETLLCRDRVIVRVQRFPRDSTTTITDWSHRHRTINLAPDVICRSGIAPGRDNIWLAV